MEQEIIGWDNLIAITVVGDQIVRRWTKLYGFPEAELRRNGKIRLLVWKRKSVIDWMNQNRNLVDTSIQRLQPRKKPISH